MARRVNPISYQLGRLRNIQSPKSPFKGPRSLLTIVQRHTHFSRPLVRAWPHRPAMLRLEVWLLIECELLTCRIGRAEDEESADVPAFSIKFYFAGIYTLPCQRCPTQTTAKYNTLACLIIHFARQQNTRNGLLGSSSPMAMLESTTLVLSCIMNMVSLAVCYSKQVTRDPSQPRLGIWNVRKCTVVRCFSACS